MKTKLRVFVIFICLVSQLVIGVGLAEAADPVHVVRRGDTLYSLARRYGTTVNAIVQANGLRNRNWIYVGQRLVVPTSGATQQTVTSGTYVVQRGDTLYSIARRHGVSVQAIASANHIYNTNLIHSGQRLVIPAAGTTTTSGSSDSSNPSAPTSGKWIDVNVAAQSLVAYEGQRPVYWATVSTGLARTPTVKGRFRIYSKYRSTTMAGPGYRYSNVPYVMFFYSGYSMHGCYWHNNFGQPMSHGCVNMRTSDAQWLYNWAPVGTLVVVH
jgi:LysM repeat protein